MSDKVNEILAGLREPTWKSETVSKGDKMPDIVLIPNSYETVESNDDKIVVVHKIKHNAGYKPYLSLEAVREKIKSLCQTLLPNGKQVGDPLYNQSVILALLDDMAKGE